MTTNKNKQRDLRDLTETEKKNVAEFLDELVNGITYKKQYNTGDRVADAKAELMDFAKNLGKYKILKQHVNSVMDAYLKEPWNGIYQVTFIDDKVKELGLPRNDRITSEARAIGEIVEAVHDLAESFCTAEKSNGLTISQEIAERDRMKRAAISTLRKYERFIPHMITESDLSKESYSGVLAACEKMLRASEEDELAKAYGNVRQHITKTK